MHIALPNLKARKSKFLANKHENTSVFQAEGSNSMLQEVQETLEESQSRKEALLNQLAEISDQAKFDSQRCKQLETEVKRLPFHSRKSLAVLSACFQLLQENVAVTEPGIS